MALKWTPTGQKHPVSGEPIFHVQSDDPTKTVLITGPAVGSMTCKDGTVYDVSPHAIECATVEHAEELGYHLIPVQHEETGRMDVPADESPTGEPVPFKHTDCHVCDPKHTRNNRKAH